MKKRVLSVLLCLALALTLLPAAALAESPTPTRTTALDLTSTAGSYLSTDKTTKTNVNFTTASVADSDEGWSWNSATKTLTLSGLILTAPGSTTTDSYGIILPGGAAIELADGSENVVASGSATGTGSSSYGIYAAGALTVTGSGTLEATGGAASSGSCGIYTHVDNGDASITISDANVAATGGSYGICAYAGNEDGSGNGGGTANITISDAEVVSGATGAEFCGGIRAYSYAGSAVITISGTSEVTATTGSNSGESALISNSCGIFAAIYDTGTSGVVISDSAAVTATGGAARSSSYGVNADTGSVTIDGSASLSAAGGAGGYYSYGVHAAGVAVSDFAGVTATGGAATSSYGICADDGDCSITGFAAVTAAGGTATYSYGIYASYDGSISITGDAAVDAAGGTMALCAYDGITLDLKNLVTTEIGEIAKVSNTYTVTYKSSTSSDAGTVATAVNYKPLRACALYFKGDGKLYKTDDVYAETLALTEITTADLPGWSADGTTLTLEDGFAFSTSNFIGLYLDGAALAAGAVLTLQVDGTASVTARNSDDADVKAVCADGSLNITGIGALTVYAGGVPGRLADGNAYTIESDKLHIIGPVTVTATSGDALKSSNGISIDEDLTIDSGATVNAASGESSSDISNAVCAGNIVIADSTVNAAAGTGEAGSDAICAGGDITITSSEIDVSGGSTTNDSCGNIYAGDEGGEKGKLTITGTAEKRSVVTVTGVGGICGHYDVSIDYADVSIGTAQSCSKDGIIANDNVSVSHSRLTVYTKDNCAIQAGYYHSGYTLTMDDVTAELYTRMIDYSGLSCIWGDTGVSIKGSTVNTYGGYDGIGAYLGDNNGITITGSAVKCLPLAGSKSPMQYGIANEDGSGDITVTDSTVTVKTEETAAADLYGLYNPSGNITLTGSAVTAESGESDSEHSSIGVFAKSGTLTVSSGTVSAKGANAAISASAGIALGSGVPVSEPTGGVVGENTDYGFTVLSGTEVAKAAFLGVPSVTVPASSDEGSVTLNAQVSDGVASVSVTDAQVQTLISNPADTGTVTVDVSSLNADAAGIPAKLTEAAATGSQGLRAVLPSGSVTLDPTALKNAGNGTLTISVKTVKPSELTAQQQKLLGNNAENAIVVDVNVLAGGVKISDFGGGVITVSFPYTPRAGEDTGKLVAWFVLDDGTLEPHAAAYDAKTGTVTFTTTHLSRYVLGQFPFTDVSDDSYYYAATVWAVNNGVTHGKTDTLFAPNDTCTRAQAVTFLWRAMGSPEPTATTCPFADVSTDAYYYKAVLWAVEKGITKGTGDTTFSPDDTCTRAQVVTFQWRTAGSPAMTTANPFTDVGSGQYYTDAVLWAVSGKITEGTTATTFSPTQNCTRAQIVTFLYRQLGK